MAAETFLLYGPSGTYKTANLGFLALWLYRLTGLRTRLISADGGGWKPIQPLIDVGIVDAWQVSNLDHILPITRKLSKGMWPKVVEERDPKSGKMAKVVRLVMTAPEEWARLGAYANEGVGSLGDGWMRNLVAQGRSISQDVVALWNESTGMPAPGQAEEPEKFGAPSQSHYGFVQNEMPTILGAFRSLPVRWNWWTSHEARGEDDTLGMKTTVLGPAIAGKKAIGKLPTWVGGMIHADSISVDLPAQAAAPAHDGKPATPALSARKESRVRYYFQNHPEPELPGKVWPAKSRLAPQAIPALLDRFPGGWFEPTTEAGLDLYFQAEMDLQAGLTDRLRGEVEETEARLREATAARTAQTAPASPAQPGVHQ